MRPRYADGRWKTPFNPSDLAHAESRGGDYTEGNALRIYPAMSSTMYRD